MNPIIIEGTKVVGKYGAKYGLKGLYCVASFASTCVAKEIIKKEVKELSPNLPIVGLKIIKK